MPVSLPQQSQQTGPTATQEFFAGCFAGFSKIYTGQPFDIVKVRLQAASGSVSPLTVVSNIIKNEGYLAFWKGSLPPLIGVGATASIQFGVNENVKRMIMKHNHGAPMTFGQLFLSGSIAGLANCIVAIPAEHFRIRMQTQPKENPVYKGSIDCMKKIFSQYGLRGAFKGTVPTLYRDCIGYGMYFANYAALTNYLAPGLSKRETPLPFIGIAGALAGMSLWATIFPLDVVKTRIQTDSFDKPTYKGMADAFRQVYKTSGVSGFYKGFGPCMARAVPVNGVVFILYEVLCRAMTPKQKVMLV